MPISFSDMHYYFSLFFYYYEVIRLHKQVCSIFGHRKIKETRELRSQLYTCMEDLILNKGVDTFLFGSKSRFNDLCYEIVSELKEKHPNIKRVYVRAEFPEISDSYHAYLLERYEDTYFPEKLLHAGKAVYVERNFEMIRKSRYCLVYYDESVAPTKRKSGTKIALSYAKTQEKTILLFPE